MNGKKEILHKMKGKVLSSSPNSGKGKRGIKKHKIMGASPDSGKGKRKIKKHKVLGASSPDSGKGKREIKKNKVMGSSPDSGEGIMSRIKKHKVIMGSSPDSGEGKSKMKKHVTHGYYLVKGKAGRHPMEDYVVAEFKIVDENNEVGLFAIFDGHLSQEIPDYLRSHLFENILREPGFWQEPESAVRRGYRITDSTILEKAVELRKGGSTAVTAILINCEKLVVANIGDSRAVMCKNGVAKQLSVDHDPSSERELVEGKGGFVSDFPGDVPRVDGRLAMTRSFGDRRLKKHLSSEPDVAMELIDDDTEFVILASDGLWKVMSNQDAVDAIKNVKNARYAARRLRA